MTGKEVYAQLSLSASIHAVGTANSEIQSGAGCHIRAKSDVEYVVAFCGMAVAHRF